MKAPRGSSLTCRGWIQEAAMRMLLNNLDPEVAENPDQLVVYGGIGKAARDQRSLEKILDCLKHLSDDETLLIQSGKPVAVFPSHKDAPRVLLANSNIVGRWQNWEHFHELDRKGLMMYGQMTAGSWIYIGTQGILQGTYETFAACGEKHFGGNLKGKWIFSGGLGGMGGAQPLAATIAGASYLGCDVDAEKIQKRVATRYLDEIAPDLSTALQKIKDYTARGEARSIGIVGNACDVLQELIKRKVVPDVVTDQTSAHDELNGYIPTGCSFSEALKLRRENPEEYIRRSFETMAQHVDAMTELKKMGARVFDYGNNIRAQAARGGSKNERAFAGFVPEYIRPLFCEGSGPFRWVALSGDPRDIAVTDEALLDLFKGDQKLERWIRTARERVAFQGLPARICWLRYGERVKAGLLFNELVKTGRVQAPIVIGRDHLDCGSVASPNRETESMRDGSDTVADWPILNALINSVNGASWVSVHQGGGVGMGYSLHAGMVIVADGTEDAARRLKRVLTSDPGMGIARHVDAGYPEALSSAKKHQLNIPFL